MVRADALRSARYRAGLTQAALAEAAQVSRSYISLLERDPRVLIGAPAARRIAAALNVNLEELIDLTPAAGGVG